MLRVFYSEAPVAWPILAFCRRKHLQDDLIRSVADRVNSNLQAGLVCSKDIRPHLALGDHLVARETRCLRVVQIRLEEKRCGRAKGTIRESLQGPDLQLV